MAGVSDDERAERLARARGGTVNVDGADRPFAEMSADDARRQAARLKEAGTWGPLQRVAKVAFAWGELARLMDERGAALVGDLPDEEVLTFAERVWVLSPEEGLIWSEPAAPAAEGKEAMNEHPEGERGDAEHDHPEPHAHEHSHGEETHSHAHDTHDHEHTQHEHEHSHGDVTHSHPHVHQEGLEDDHAHEHEEG